MIERAESVDTAGTEARGRVPHDELPEPVIEITALEDDAETGKT